MLRSWSLPAAVAVVPVDCGWSDVGSWQAAWELGAKDGAGNVLAGVDGTVVDAQGRPVDIIQRRELSHERGAPGRVTRIVFSGHARITERITLAERTLEARHQLVVPVIVDALTGALNEEDLSGRHLWPSLYSTATDDR